MSTKDIFGIAIDIFKSRQQSFSNGGVTAEWDEAIAVSQLLPRLDNGIRPGAQGPQQVPILMLLADKYGRAILVPRDLLEQRRWTMFGGCFGWSTDSRFREAVGLLTRSAVDFPVPIHDRVEG
jgi:hypothetical protein